MRRKKTGKIGKRDLKVRLTPEQVAESAQDLDNFHANKAERNAERVPTGVHALDVVMGGGVPEGKLTSVFGRERRLPPGMAAIKPPSRRAYYIDVQKAVQSPDITSVLERISLAKAKGEDLAKMAMMIDQPFKIGDKVLLKVGERGRRWGAGVIEAIEDGTLGIAFQPEEDFKGLSWRKPEQVERAVVGWLASFDNHFEDVRAEMIWAKTEIEAKHRAVNALEIEWDDANTDDFELRREPRLDGMDEFSGRGPRVPIEVQREIGLREEGSRECDTCGLGQLYDPKTKDYIGEVCEQCGQCDECGCMCCPECIDQLNQQIKCEACNNSGYIEDYKRLRRYIRLKEDGTFEGVVWVPGQKQLNEEYDVSYPAELLSNAVRAFCQKAGPGAYIEWSPRPSDRITMHLANVAATVLFVQENPDGSITVRGKLMDTHPGMTLKGIWDMQRGSYPAANGEVPEGVVPWKIAGKGLGHTDDEGVCDELSIVGFEIVED